jgi:hypothetical protein
LSDIGEALSVSDFHALLIDPKKIAGPPRAEIFLRRRGEVQDLIQKKGGIVICLLRPNDLQFAIPGVGQFNRYSLLDQVGSKLLTAHIGSGAGSSVISVNSARGPTASYFQVLRQNLQF